jgi:hypothetical protein
LQLATVAFFATTTPYKKITKKMKRREGAYLQAPAFKPMVMVATSALPLPVATYALSLLVVSFTTSAFLLQVPSSTLLLHALPSFDDGVKAK